MKFAVLSFYEAYPPESGAAAVTYNTALHLPGQTTLIQLGDTERRVELSSHLTLVTIASESKHRFKKALALRNKFKKISDVIKDIEPDVLVLEGASWAPYYVLQLGRLNRLGRTPRIIYHAHNVEYRLRRERKDRLIAGLTRWAEKKLIRDADLATAVSESDALEFNRLYGVRPALLPNGVDISAFDSVGDEEVERIRKKYSLKGFTVLFMGLITYPPTRDGLQFLMKGVFPSLAEARPDMKLVVIGGDVREERRWLNNPGLIPFEEVPALIKACDVCVAPIFSGSGTRVKILEYLAARKPVISTAKGAEGLDAEAGRHLVLAEKADDFKHSILKLADNRDLAARLGGEGRELVEMRYSWPRIFEQFIQKIERIMLPDISKEAGPVRECPQDKAQ